MAIREEIVVDATDNGSLKTTTDQINNLTAATKKAGESSKEMANEQKGAANSVLENGGAMGLLNDLTGGYAMMVKDAVEASVLFTRSQKLAAAQQKIYTAVVGASSGAMKIFRIALVSTGIGAIVVALGLLIANFDKVKKVVMNLIPGFSMIADFIGGIVDAVTDFIGVTSDATRALDKMVANADASLKRSEHFLEANGDKYDEYTQRKMKANIDYNKKVKELAEDEELTDKEKLQRINDFREKANREIAKADADRFAEQEKKRKEAADKEAEAAQRAADEAKKRRDDAIAREKERTTSIAKLIDDYRKKEEDAAAKNNLDKINLEEKRALAELGTLKATEEQKAKVREYYNNRRKEEESTIEDELNRIRTEKQDAVRDLQLDQKQWEIDNETDPVIKLQKQREVIEEQGKLDLEKLQRDIDNANLSTTERANKEIEYAKVKQDLDQSLKTNDNQLAEEQKTRDEAVANNRVNVAMTTASLLANLGGKGAEFAKGMAVAQAVQDTYKGAVSAYSAMAGIPIVGPALGAVAAGVVVAAGVANVKKILASKPTDKSAPSPTAGGSVPSGPAAPSFNMVQGTGANQIAEAVVGQNAPIKAYVVSNNVTTAQSMDRNSVENSLM